MLRLDWGTKVRLESSGLDRAPLNLWTGSDGYQSLRLIVPHSARRKFANFHRHPTNPRDHRDRPPLAPNREHGHEIYHSRTPLLPRFAAPPFVAH
jgi:hypothetical protein